MKHIFLWLISALQCLQYAIWTQLAKFWHSANSAVFDKNWLASDNVLVRYLNVIRVLQCYFLLLFIILLCVFAVCIFGVFVYAYDLFSVLWAQL